MPQSYTKKKGKRFFPDEKKFLFNIDTVWFNVNAENYQLAMDEYLGELLREGREYLMDTDEKLLFDVDIPGYENKIVFEIHGGQPPLYQYSLRNDDIAIYFAKNERESQLPMKVQINQSILWEKGLVNCYLEMDKILTSLGFVTGRVQLNRIDLCVHSDQFQFTLKDLEKFEYPRNISKDNFPNFMRLNPSTGEFETVYFGNRERLLLRIYNKSKESKRKGKDYFFDIYKKHGLNPDKVWNVEFEIRRPFLKELCDIHGIKLFDDFDKVIAENRISLLWKMLMSMFTHDSAFWKILENGKEGVFEKSEGFIQRKKSRDYDAMREVAQIRGRLMTVFLNGTSANIDDAIARFKELNAKYEEKKEKDFSSDLINKRRKVHDEQLNEFASLDVPGEKGIEHFPKWLHKFYEKQGKTYEKGKIKALPNKAEVQ